MSKTRTQKSIYMILTGVILQVVTILFSFLNRTVFIKILGLEYQSINSLFTNILSILALANLGFDTAIIYFMYKPLADNNTEEIKELMSFYKKIYRAVGAVIFLLGLCIIPFLSKLVNLDTQIDVNITLIYMLFLFDTVSSYMFFSYRNGIITADQKGYILNVINLIFVMVESIAEMAIIFITRNFIFALVCKIGINLLKNITVYYQVGRIYPFLNEKASNKLSRNTVKEIKQKVYSIFVFRISYTLFNSTDNMIISAFIGTIYVGINSNYLLLISAVNRMLDIILKSFVGAVGNINAVESEETKYLMFRRLDFFNFVINSICGVCFYQLFNPFITLWLGDEFLFSQAIVAVIVINLLNKSFLNIVFVYRETMGLFEYGKYRHLVGGIVNIILSIILAKPLGVFGVFIATTIASMSLTTFLYPKVVYKYGFNKNYGEYIIRFIMYFALTIASCGIVKILCSAFGEVNYLNFIAQALISVAVPSLLYYLIFRKTDEYLYFKSKGLNMLKGFINKVNLKVKAEA